MPLFDKIAILYGTETGNSQDLSKIIAWQLSRLQKSVLNESKIVIDVMSCDDYPIRHLPDEKFILIICSTSGLGEPPLNMRSFYRFLMCKNLSETSLSDLQFAVIGLGDSSYAKYNYVAKKIFKRLKQLGAKSLLDLVLGDDQHEYGPFYTIDPWLQKFYQLLLPETNLQSLFDNDDLIVPSIQIIESEIDENSDISDDCNHSMSNTEHESIKYDQLNPFTAKVISNKRLTAEDHFQDVRLIELQLDSTIQYKLNDICVVYPENLDEQIEEFFRLFNDGVERLKSNQLIKLRLNKQNWLPQSSYYHHLINQNNKPLSTYEIVKRYMDINSIPKRSFFDLFYRFSQDRLEFEKLKRFASGSDLEDLYDYVNRPKRTILEVMADFPHTTPHVPLEYLFDLIPAMSWRSYSIASTPLLKPNSIEILYAVVEYRTRLKRPRRGQCTTWMVQQQKLNESYLNIFLRRSTFVLPDPNDRRPWIMIAAGTGVAPFRAFIHDRCERNLGENYLFFGCRYHDKDYYLRDEWEILINKGLLRVFPAFSRENSGNGSKTYVQNIVWQQRCLVYRLFQQSNAIILIAGKSKQYPELVRETLINIFKENIDDNDIDVDKLITKYEQQKRIQFECW